MAELSKVKSDLIAEIEKRVEDHVLEPSNAELLTKLISQADNDNEAISIAALGTTYKRTGLHFDKRLERLTHDIRYFRKNEKLSFRTDNNKPVHKLIIGDNYEALQNLLIQYTGAIDVIYIDPPYGKDSMGEFAQTNYQNAITRDNLLSMLYPRLQLAKQLLSDSGVIFCSIDDKNQAYVKCLFDEVFGEVNFIADVIWERADSPRMDAKDFSTRHESILVYARNKSTDPIKKLHSQEIPEHYNKIDENGNRYYLKPLRYMGNADARSDRPNMYFPIEAPDGELVYPIRTDGTEGRWRWSKEKVIQEKNRIEWVKTKSGWSVYTKLYASDELEIPVETIWFNKDVEGNRQAIALLKSIFGDEKMFSNPKPIKLIQRILEIAGTQNSIILDFFAGSGTTGHAVLDLNRSEEKEGDLFADTNTGGNRTFILCQMNEKTDTTPNGIAYDVTAKRLKRIMTGECYDGTKDFEWIKKNKPYGGNLDVYEIDKVADFEYTEGKSPFDVIDETLYGQARFATLQEKIDWVCSHFGNARKQLEK